VDAAIEERVVRTLIAPQRRAQYLSRLASEKTRQKFMNTHLFHMRDLDARFAQQLPTGQQNSEDVLRLLHERGAPDRCYVISGSSDFDGEEVELGAAVDDVFDGSDGTFVVCVPDRLAYFQGEEPGEGYLLERR
jgi:hypothetical protein